LVYFKFYLLVF